MLEIQCQLLPVIVLGQSLPQKYHSILANLNFSRVLSNVQQCLGNCGPL